MKQNKNCHLLDRAAQGRVFMALLFCSAWFGRAVEKGSLLSADRLCHSRIILQSCVKGGQAGSEKLVWTLSTAQRCCLGSHHPHYQISAAFHLAEKQRFYLITETSIQCLVWEQMWWFLCIVANAGENLCLFRNRLVVSLIAWESGSQRGPPILLKSYHRTQYLLSHAAGRLVRPLNRSSDWGILAAWCDALALRPGWCWGGVEPSQIQKCFPARETCDLANTWNTDIAAGKCLWIKVWHWTNQTHYETRCYSSFFYLLHRKFVLQRESRLSFLIPN